jgi:hypothetical protein
MRKLQRKESLELHSEEKINLWMDDEATSNEKNHRSASLKWRFCVKKGFTQKSTSQSDE